MVTLDTVSLVLQAGLAIVAALGGELRGDPEHLIARIGPLDTAGGDAITFVAQPKSRNLLEAIESFDARPVSQSGIALSTMPSQLSSMPLQTSVLGMLVTLQTSLPF